MSLRNLFGSDCGSENPVVKLIRNLVQGHEINDQDIIDPIQVEDNDQHVLDASQQETVDELFDSPKQDMFEMDEMLAAIKDVEEDPFLVPIMSNSSENKMLNKHQNQESNESENLENNGTEINFDMNTESEIIRELLKLDHHYSISDCKDSNSYWHQFLHSQKVESIFGTDTMTPSTSGLEEPVPESIILVEEKCKSSVENIQTLKSENSTEKDESNSRTRKSELEELKNAGNKIYYSLTSWYETWTSKIEELKNKEHGRKYSFSPCNKKDLLLDPLTEGKKQLKFGQVPTAVLCFETTVKREPSNAEAWLLLGSSQAENDQDFLAIIALNKCIQLKPENLTAMLCLADCYINEKYKFEAGLMLMEWLIQNPKYSDIVKSKSRPDDKFYYLMKNNNSTICTYVLDMYIEASQRSLETGVIDADVQNGLGILFNAATKHDKAIACFKAAVKIRPDDAHLWNRFGTTLAISGQLKEAREAYKNALQFSPGFVKAWVNLGLSCIHLGKYSNAVQHMLEAVNLQSIAKSFGFQGPSEKIWDSLSLAIQHSENPEMIYAVHKKDLDILNVTFNYYGLKSINGNS